MNLSISPFRQRSFFNFKQLEYLVHHWEEREAPAYEHLILYNAEMCSFQWKWSWPLTPGSSFFTDLIGVTLLCVCVCVCVSLFFSHLPTLPHRLWSSSLPVTPPWISRSKVMLCSWYITCPQTPVLTLIVGLKNRMDDKLATHPHSETHCWTRKSMSGHKCWTSLTTLPPAVQTMHNKTEWLTQCNLSS